MDNSRRYSTNSAHTSDRYDALETTDANAPVSSYASVPASYSAESLEVHVPGASPAYSPEPSVDSESVLQSVQFSHHRTLIISAVIAAIVLLLTSFSIIRTISRRNADTGTPQSKSTVAIQDVDLKGDDAGTLAPEFTGDEQSLLVNGDVISRGFLKFSRNAFIATIDSDDLEADQTYRLPNASGTFCLDSNNCDFATADDLQAFATQVQLEQLRQSIPVGSGIASLTAGSANLSISDDGDGNLTITDVTAGEPRVTALNGESGNVTLSVQGTANQVSVSQSGNSFTLSTPQDINTGATPSFSGLILSTLDCTGFANGGTLTTNGAGQLICDNDDGGAGSSITGSGTAGAIARFDASQNIVSSIITESGTIITIGGTVTATSFSGSHIGDGSALTALNAASIASGTLADARLSSSVTTQGNTFNGAGQLVQLNGSSQLPAVSGALLTTLNAANIASGTLNDLRLSSNVSLLGATIGLAELDADSVNSSKVVDGSIANIDLTNSSLTVTAGGGLVNGGSVSLGGSTTLNIGAGDGITVNADDVAVDSTVCRTTGNCVGGGSGGAPNIAAYITVGNDATLTGERAITAGSNLSSLDGGANGAFTINVVNSPSFSGGVTAASFSGAGSALTALNASNVSSGTLADARLSANVTLQGNSFNGASQLVQLDGTSRLPAVNGSFLTNLNGSNISTGTVANARLVGSGALTVTAGTGLSGGGSAALGGSTTLNLADTAVSPGTYGSASQVSQVTVDQQGRITSASNVAITGLNSCSTCVSLQGATPGTPQTGHINVTGTIIAGNFSGDGSALTALNASNVSSGTLADARLSANVTLQGNSFNGASQLVQLNGSTQLPAVSGALLTNLNGSNIASGTVADARLSANVALLNATQTFTNAQTYSATSNANIFSGVPSASATASVIRLGAAIAGGSANGTYIGGNPASFGGDFINLQVGGVSQLRVTGAGAVTATSFAGNGASLTNLNGSNISTGTVANARLVGSGALTVSAGTGLSGGGSAALGGSTTLNLADTAVSPGTYGSANQVAQVTVDQQGRITGASNVAITGLNSCSTCVSLQGATPGTPQTGHINVTGTIIAANFSGDGSALTALNASNVSSGTLADARLSANVTLQGNSFNGASQLVQLNGSTQLPAVSGALLTNLNGSNIASGTVAIARGGTGGSATPTAGAVAYGTGSAYAFSGVGSSGNCLLSGAAGTPTWGSCGAGGTGDITQGGNSFGGAMTIGTNDNFALNLETNLITRLSINTSGLLNLSAYDCSAFDNGGVLTVNASGDVVCEDDAGGAGGSGITGSGTAGTLAKFDASQNIVNSIITESGTTVTVGGTLAATTLQGAGSGITTLNASNVSSGTLADARLSANVTLQGNSFNGASQLVQLNGSTQLPAVSGALLTNLNGSNIASGTVADARLSANVALLNATQTFTNAQTYSATSNANIFSGVPTASATASVIRLGAAIAGGSANGTYIGGNPASFGGDFINLQVGGVSQLRVTGAGAVTATSFAGNGASLTNLNGSNISTGTVANARLVGSGALTVTAGTGLSGGGSAALGGSTTLNLADTAVSPGTYGSASQVSQVTVDQQGRITSASNVAITGLNSCSTCVSLQGATPGTPQTGHINVTGTIIAGNFSGDGSALTALNASNVSSGTLADARLSANVTLQGNSFNGASQLVQLNGSTQLPAVSGALLTNLNGSNIASGTVADARLSANVALLNATQTFTNAQTYSATSNANIFSGVPTASATASVIRLGAAIAGGSANGTYIGGNPASFGGDFINLQVGGVSQLRVTGAGAVTATSFAGNGASLTNLNGSNISTGTVANARLVGSGALTVTAGTGLSGGGSAALGGSTTLNLADTAVSPGTYGSASQVSQVTVDQQGRITSASNVAITGLNSCSTCVSLQGATPGTPQTGHINVTGTIIAGNFSGDGSALTALNASNLASGTVTGARVSGSYTGITGLGTITVGVWNGTSIADTNVDNNLTISSTGAVDWQALNNYPGACGAGSAISTLADTPTCTAFNTDTSITLQDAYAAGNTIVGTTGRNISFTLADLATDQVFEVTQAGATDAFRVNDDGTFNDSTPFVIDQNGNVGIGTATASQLLTVSGVGMFGTANASEVLLGMSVNTVGHEGVSLHHDGTEAFLSSVDAGTAWQDLSIQANAVRFDINGLTDNVIINSTGVGIGISPTTALDVNGGLRVQGTSASASGATLFASLIGTQTAASTGSFHGIRTSISYTNAGTLEDLQAVDALPTNSGIGTVTQAYGVVSRVTNSSSGDIGSAVGLWSQISNSGTGDITDANGLYIQSPINTGTIANTYGIFINTQTAGTQTATPYGIYQAGTTDRNYFGGTVIVNSNILPNANPSGSSTSQVITSPDNTADVVGSYTSIAIAGDGLPIISYYDTTNTSLKVTKCNDVDCAGVNETITTVDNTASVGTYTFIAIGSDGLPIVSYRDGTNTSLKVAKCNDNACAGGDETISTVDNAADVGYDSSIAIGVDGLPIIAYYDNTPNGALKVAKCNDLACTGNNETITTVDTAGDSGNNTSIAIGTDGLPVISYLDTTNGRLRAVKCANISCSDTANDIISTLDATANVGTYTSLAIGNDGLPVVSYLNYGLNTLKFVRCTRPDCSTAATPLTLDGTGNVGLVRTSLKIGTDGMPIIAYWHITGGGGDNLRVAKCSEADCTGTVDLTTVESTNAVGNYPAIAIGTNGLPIISYYDATNGNLRVARCANTACTSPASGAYTGGSNIGSVGTYFNNIYAQQFWGKSFQIAAFDLAEEYNVSDSTIEAGDVVRIAQGTTVERTTNEYDLRTLGIVSTAPAITLGDWEQTGDTAIKRPVALSGRVPVKIASDSAAIQPGDYLTTSATEPGKAKKADRSGQVIGKALGAWTPGSGVEKITVFVTTSHANPIEEIQGSLGAGNFDTLSVLGEATIGSLTVENGISTRTLEVTEDATIGKLTVITEIATKDITVTGTATIATLKVTGSAEFGGDIRLSGIGNTRNAITKRFVASTAIEAGSVVIADPENDGQVTTTSVKGDRKVIGIAATAAINPGDEIEVAIGGTIQVRLDSSVSIAGDLITSSDQTGMASVATEDAKIGTIVGKATSKKDTSGLIWILVTLQ